MDLQARAIILRTFAGRKYGIDLRHLHLVTIPETIGACDSLIMIVATYNQIETLPEAIGSCQNLEELYLSYNRLQSLPKALVQCSKLSSLHLNNCSFTHIPDVVFQLPKLFTLLLDGNDISQIPEDITNLKELRVLDVSGNRLEVLPAAISELKTLHVLSVANNKLTSLPDISQLVYLQNLAIHGNPITSISLELLCMSHLLELILPRTAVVPDAYSEAAILGCQTEPFVPHLCGTPLVLSLKECCLQTILEDYKPAESLDYVLQVVAPTEDIHEHCWHGSCPKTGIIHRKAKLHLNPALMLEIYIRSCVEHYYQICTSFADVYNRNIRINVRGD